MGWWSYTSGRILERGLDFRGALREGAAEWANRAMRWLVEEIGAGRGYEVLMKAAKGFVERVGGNRAALIEGGLDEGLLDECRRAVGT